MPIAPKTVAKRIEMHGSIHMPGKADKLNKLVDFIDAWEKLKEKYYEMGGQQIQTEDQCTIILKMLPNDTPPSMVMQLQEYTDIDSLKAKIEKQCEFWADHMPTGASRVQLESGEAPPPAEEPGEGGETQEEE